MDAPPQRTTYLDYCTGLQNERNRKFKISNKNAVSKKKNNRFGIYGIVSILFIIFLLFFPIHTVLSLKYSKPESLLNYFEKNFDYFEKYSFGYRKQVKLTKGVVIRDFMLLEVF